MSRRASPYLHVGVFLHGRQARHVEPVACGSVLQIVALVLDLTERVAAEAVKLEHELLLIVAFANEDVRLFANTFKMKYIR